jgi:hypothetical protein
MPCAVSGRINLFQLKKELNAYRDKAISGNAYLHVLELSYFIWHIKYSNPLNLTSMWQVEALVCYK